MTKKILVADDVSWIREMVREKLESVGYDVETVDNGGKAVEAYRAALDKEDAFALILLDIEMPERTGLEVLQDIRDMEKDSKATYTPIIMLTACEDEWMKSVKGGCDDYILKPYEERDLLCKVEKTLREKELRDDLFKKKGIG